MFASALSCQVENEKEYWASFTHLEALPVACCVCNKEGNILFANQLALILWGRALQHDTEYGWGDCKLYDTAGQEITYDQSPVVRAVAENCTVQIEAQIERPDGSRSSVNIHVKPLLQTGSTPPGALVTLFDISVQKQTERELNASKELNKNLLLHTHIGIIISNQAGEIQSVNSFAESLTGYTADELIGTHITDLFRNPVNHLEVLKKMAAELNIPFTNPGSVVQAYIRQKGFIYRENRVLTKNGQLIKVSSSVSGLFDEHDNFIGFVNKISDLSAQKEAENSLHHTTNRLQLATQAASIGVWEFDYISGQRFWDERTYELFGVDRQTPPLAPEEFLQLVHPDDRANIQAKLNDLVHTNALQSVMRINRADTGELVYIHSQGKLLKGPDGTLERFIAISHDVTQSHLATLALKASEERFRNLAELVDDLFWIGSASEPRFLYVNPTFERLFGLNREDLYENQLSFLDQILVEDRPRVQAIFLNLNPDSAYHKFRILDARGQIRWVEACALLVKDEHEQVQFRIGVGRDITLQQERETFLQLALTQEQELSRRKSDFITTASHEFRTPLTTMQSSVDLIKLYLQPFDTQLPKPVQGHIGKIEEKILHISGLLDDILTLSRIEAGKFSYVPQRMDLVSFCRQIAEADFSNLPGEESLYIQVEGLPRDVILDAKLIKQIVENLISNALKFSQKPVGLKLYFGEKDVHIAVTDQGIGIPAIALPHLFERFYRADNAGTIQGTGLGLSIVKQFVEIQGGQIEVDSQEGQGSCFRVIFPQ